MDGTPGVIHFYLEWKSVHNYRKMVHNPTQKVQKKLVPPKLPKSRKIELTINGKMLINTPKRLIKEEKRS